MLLCAILSKASLIYLRLNELKVAKMLATELLSVHSSIYGEFSLESAKSTLELGEICEIQGQFNKAKVSYLRLLEVGNDFNYF